MSRGIVAVVSLALSVLLLACGAERPVSEPESAPPWGAAAEDWLGRVQEAGTQGVRNLEAFLAPGVVLDHRATGGDRARGVEESLRMVWDFPYSHPGLRLSPPAYLSRTGMLVPASWQGPGLYTVVDAVVVMRLSAQGLLREETLPSVVTGADTVAPGRDWSSVLDQVRRYVAARNRHGEHLVVQSLGPGRGPAVYAAPARSGARAFRRVVALLRSQDPRGCPGHLAVTLRPRIGGGLVAVSGLRYRRIDDGRRCLHGAARFDGWWTAMTMPQPVPDVRTGTVRVGGVTVVMWYGTPVLERLVEWALWRFRSAGLEVPPAASVSYYPTADRCQRNFALALGPERDRIVACFGEDLACITSPCPPWSDLAKTIVLHELAHTWLHHNVGAETQAAYERLVGLRWEDPSDPWESRAGERATEVIAQGVQVEPNSRPLIDIPRARLVAEFTVLTGRPPRDHGP